MHRQQKINLADPLRAANDQISNQVGHATPTGSTDTAVLRFAAGANSPLGGNSFTEANTAAAGAVVTISQEGIYQVDLNVPVTGAVLVAAGIGFGMSAGGGITADPVVGTNGVIKAADVDCNASMTLVISLTTFVFIRMTAVTTVPSGATFRFLATDSAGGAPAGLVAAGISYRIRRIFGSNPF